LQLPPTQSFGRPTNILTEVAAKRCLAAAFRLTSLNRLQLVAVPLKHSIEVKALVDS
jgi:hypothetical protein